MEETIDLREYFSIIKKRFWIIVLITVIAVSITTAITYFTKVQMYQARTSLIVNVEKSEGQPMLTGDQITAGQKLAILYGEIIKSRAVLQPVIDKLNLEMSAGQLAGMISISQVKDTHIMNLSVQDTNPERARDIANYIPPIFTEEVKRITKANGVEVIDTALMAYPIGSNDSMNIVISAVLGIMIGLFVIFLIEYLDNKIKTPQDIEKHLDLPLLGVIPNESIAK